MFGLVVNGAAEALATAAYGALSALVPLINSEAYALVAAARSDRAVAVVVVVALAAGQTAGKLVLFEAARRGAGCCWSSRVRARLARHGESRAADWAARINSALTRRRTRVLLLLASSALGLPPLAAVSLAAGTSRQPRWEFAAVCLTGRAVRFAVLVLPAVYALT